MCTLPICFVEIRNDQKKNYFYNFNPIKDMLRSMQYKYFSMAIL